MEKLENLPRIPEHAATNLLIDRVNELTDQLVDMGKRLVKIEAARAAKTTKK